MFSFALEMGAIETHPLVRFPLLPVQEKSFRVMTVEEFRTLIDAMESPSLAALVAVMGETGIRKGEALRLEWRNVDMREGILTAEHTKSRKVRHIPLSRFALEWLMKTVRYLESAHVFVNELSKERWINPEKAFRKGRRTAGLDWVGFHDLRRYRISQWVMRGVDLRTVQLLAGHAEIKTTMRYAHLSPSHTVRSVRQAEASELEDLAAAGEKRATKTEAVMGDCAK